MIASMSDDVQHLVAGWYVQLLGDTFDLEDWEYTLNEPFDPVALREPDGTFLLRSVEFQSAETASEVHEKGKALIDRLNGSMRLMHNSRPAKIGSIIRIEENGARHANVFAEGLGLALGRSRCRAVGVAIGPDGLPLQPPPPQPSDPQSWNAMAASDDVVSDLLEQLGKSENWYEIYKTIELAERLVGGESKLKCFLGSSAGECKNLKQTANFYRHARAHRPKHLTNLAEAKSLLNFMARIALAERMKRPLRCPD
jgi:hypothetical protein